MVLAVELGRERKRKERKEEACPAGGRTRLGENISIVLSRTCTCNILRVGDCGRIDKTAQHRTTLGESEGIEEFFFLSFSHSFFFPFFSPSPSLLFSILLGTTTRYPVRHHYR